MPRTMKRFPRFRARVLLPLLAVIASSLSALAAEPPAAPAGTARQWGTATLARIHEGFYLPQQSLYALEVGAGTKPRPGWIWDASIQLGALCSAARLEPQTYLPQVRSYATALRAYRTMHKGIPGLDVNPPPKPPDRYYDDNAWISMALLEAYELTKDPKDLALASDAFNFTMSGEDDKTFGGGIFWHEDQTKSKNACSSGPAMLAAMRFHKVTGEAKYLAIAKRLYDWTRAHLQDADGLVSDSISVPDGKVDGRKFTYNSATLIHSACLLYGVTGEKAYLDEARRVAKASEKRFVRARDGAITGSGKLGVKLVEAYLCLAEADHDAHWREVVARCLVAVHAQRNAGGGYAQDWNAPPLAADKPVRLIDQSAAARGYWVAAEHGVDLR
jgi:hypothetical protein